VKKNAREKEQRERERAFGKRLETLAGAVAVSACCELSVEIEIAAVEAAWMFVNRVRVMASEKETEKKTKRNETKRRWGKVC